MINDQRNINKEDVKMCAKNCEMLQFFSAAIPNISCDP